MKLVRFGETGRKRPGGIAGDGRRRDLAEHIEDIHGPTLTPIDRWLVASDAIGDLRGLNIRLEVDGERARVANTATMVFSCAEIAAYLRRFMTLYPGDVIASATPPGIGMGRKPNPEYLKTGDQVRRAIDGLGLRRHDAVAFEAASHGAFK